MQIFNKFKNTRGFISGWERMIRFRDMITSEAQRRARIITFWQKHGFEAVHEAFSVSRATLFRWQRALKEAGGRLEALNKTSTAPRRRRQRVISPAIEDFILKERRYDPKLSKDKLAVLMRQDGLACLSASTVGRLLSDLKKQGKLPDGKRIYLSGRTGRLIERRPRSPVKRLRSKNHAGGLVKADTLVRFTNGIKRYIITAIDRESKFAFACGYRSRSSKAAVDFMEKFIKVAPVSVSHIQTDNGSEFANHFDVFLETNGLVHFHAYPRSPKMQSEIERFNRTLHEAFAVRHRESLAYDLEVFNEKLMDWLLWYNARRPHWSLGLISPLRYICNQLPVAGSQMWWTDTRP